MATIVNINRPYVALLAITVLAVAIGGCGRSEREVLTARNHLKQIGLGLTFHEIIRKQLPAHASHDAAGKPLLSWRVQVLPYLETTDQPGLYEEFHLDEPWDSPHNMRLIERMPDVYSSAGYKLGPGKTCFLAVVGEGCAFDGTAQGKHVGLVADDSPKQILVVEAAADKAVVWTKPDDFELEVALPSARASQQSVGWSALWADGKVTFANADEVAAYAKVCTNAPK